MGSELRLVNDMAAPKQPSTVPRLVSLQQLAELWQMPYSWLKEACRSRCADPLPRFQFGRYPRVDLNDPALAAWLNRRRRQGRTN
jgi:hypothetical protein